MEQLPVRAVATASITIQLTNKTQGCRNGWQGNEVGSIINSSNASGTALGEVKEIISVSPTSISFNWGGYVSIAKIDYSFKGSTISVGTGRYTAGSTTEYLFNSELKTNVTVKYNYYV